MSISKLSRKRDRFRSRIQLPSSIDPDFLRPMRNGPCFLTSGGSILRPDGEFVFIHTSDFADNILMGNNCFLCGCYPDGEEFNHEHVISDWLLRYTGISNMSITLPNGRQMRYSSYKVRSCVQCNSFLSRNVEGPVSKAIKGGFESFSEFLRQDPKLVFQWLCLIYYKVHFRDFSLKLNVDERDPDIPIGALYAWPNFHHIFCVARSVIFEANLSSHVIGTMKVFQLRDWEKHGSYDYRDNWITDTLFIRVRDVCMYVSFTDAKAVDHMISDKFTRVPWCINHIQAIEIFGDFISAKMHFNQQHNFHSFYDPEGDFLKIIAEIPSDFGWFDLNPQIRGVAQVLAFQSEFGEFTMNGLSHKETFNELATGEVTFFPLEGGGEYGYVEHEPPDDLEHARNVLRRATEEKSVQSALKTMTKGYYDKE